MHRYLFFAGFVTDPGKLHMSNDLLLPEFDSLKNRQRIAISESVKNAQRPILILDQQPANSMGFIPRSVLAQFFARHPQLP